MPQKLFKISLLKHYIHNILHRFFDETNCIWRNRSLKTCYCAEHLSKKKINYWRPGILEFWNFGIILPSLLALKHPNKQHHHHHPLLQYLSTTVTAAQEQHGLTFNSTFQSRHYCVQQTPLFHLTAHCCNGETAFESTRRWSACSPAVSLAGYSKSRNARYSCLKWCIETTLDDATSVTESRIDW